MDNAIKDGQVSLRLPLDMKEQMESYARLTGRNKSHVVMEAVGEYLAWRVPQIEDLKAAIRAADAGEFATDAEVDAVFTRHAGSPARASSRKAPVTVKTAPRRGR